MCTTALLRVHNARAVVDEGRTERSVHAKRGKTRRPITRDTKTTVITIRVCTPTVQLTCIAEFAIAQRARGGNVTKPTTTTNCSHLYTLRTVYELRCTTYPIAGAFILLFSGIVSSHGPNRLTTTGFGARSAARVPRNVSSP
uniref:Uncharacterized protein n=1 Tax=Sipha flava TaxID=143950 RepID=A0A2S2QRF9_9HEMI